MDGYQVAVHAIGDRANKQAIDAIAELSATYKGDRRWRIEHAQVVDPADMPAFGRYGIIASVQPIHATSDRVMAEARLGEARLAGDIWTAGFDLSRLDHAVGRVEVRHDVQAEAGGA
ncbi:hypothetical protein LTR94_033625, partial [Friedmanniomyces endolithicus]